MSTHLLVVAVMILAMVSLLAWLMHDLDRPDPTKTIPEAILLVGDNSAVLAPETWPMAEAEADAETPARRIDDLRQANATIESVLLTVSSLPSPLPSLVVAHVGRVELATGGSLSDFEHGVAALARLIHDGGATLATLLLQSDDPETQHWNASLARLTFAVDGVVCEDADDLTALLAELSPPRTR